MLTAYSDSTQAPRYPAFDAAIDRIKHAEIAERYRHKRKGKPFSFNEHRVKLLTHIAFYRYGPILPDNDEGRNFVFAVAVHLVDPERIRQWLDEAAPWYDEDDADALIRRIARKGYRYSGPKLAKFLGLTFEDLSGPAGDRTIGRVNAIDAPPAFIAEVRARRLARKRERDRLWQANRRRAAGAVPRERSASRLKPWELLGFKCRRTWERHGKPGVANASSSILAWPQRRRACDTPSKRLGPRGGRAGASRWGIGLADTFQTCLMALVVTNCLAADDADRCLATATLLANQYPDAGGWRQ